MREQPPVPERILSLRLRGTTLDFPDGQPFCLVCGASPAGTRRARFQALDPTGVSRFDGVIAGIQAISEGIAFDAPLRAPHRRRSIREAVIAPLLGLAGVAVVACGAVLEPREGSEGPGKVYG